MNPLPPAPRDAIETALIERVLELLSDVDTVANGHENGGALGVTDHLNRARVNIAALHHRWGSNGLDAATAWTAFGDATPRVIALLESAVQQNLTPGIGGDLPSGLLSQNPTVPDAKVRALYQRRFGAAKGAAESGSGRVLDASDNSVMGLRFCSPSALKERLWELVLQLRARRRSAQWTDVTDAVIGGARRDETTGKITGSGIVTVLEWRAILDPVSSAVDLTDDETFWLVRTALENTPFVDVSSVFQARNLTSRLRDLIGRADVSVNHIGTKVRERVPLYAAIHQHYSADTAALVDVFVRGRVLANDETPHARAAFLAAADQGGNALAPYIAQSTLVGFKRQPHDVKVEALEVVARLWHTVHHSLPTKQSVGPLLLYVAPSPTLSEAFEHFDAPSAALVDDVASTLPRIRAAISAAPDGHIALQRLRLFSLLRQWCLLRRPIGDDDDDAFLRVVWLASGGAAFADVGRTPAPSDATAIAHATLTAKHDAAARRVMAARVDVDLDPLWVDAVLKESALRRSTNESNATTSWWTEGGQFVVDGLFGVDDARTNSNPPTDVPSVPRRRPNDGLVLHEWNDDAVMNSRPRVVFCSATDLPPALCHARFWAAEHGIDLVPVDDVAPLLDAIDRGRVQVNVASRAATVTLDVAPHLPVSPRQRQPIEFVATDPGECQTADWADFGASPRFVRLPPVASDQRVGELGACIDDTAPYVALQAFGAKSVLLEGARSAIETAGAKVPSSAVVSFGAARDCDWESVVDTLKTLLPPRRAWIFRSAGRTEDLPGHSRTGELLSVGNARSASARVNAARAVATCDTEPMSLLVQSHLRATTSGVTFSRAPDGAMGQVSYQVVRGGGGGVRADTAVHEGILYAYGDLDPARHAPRAHRQTLQRVTLDVEQALNDVFFPSGNVLWPIEIEWLVANGTLYVVQARFQLQPEPGF